MIGIFFAGALLLLVALVLAFLKTKGDRMLTRVLPALGVAVVAVVMRTIWHGLEAMDTGLHPSST